MKDFIRLEHVSKIYGDIRALDDISLTIDQGEFVAVLGESGSGKSTLMNMIGTLDRPDEGRYYFEGENILHYDDRRLSIYRNRVIGFIFQGFHLDPSLTALENVTMPLVYSGIRPRNRQQLARQALEQVGLAKRMTHRPSQLSGGQKQRVCIARALVGRPKVILADEPTGNLDRKSGEMVMDLLTKLWQEGYTVIMVTHNEQQARRAARILEISDGKVLRDEPTRGKINL
jgi:putative ABC transport system ATP-binding protein